MNLIQEITELCDGREDITDHGGPNLAMQIMQLVRDAAPTTDLRKLAQRKIAAEDRQRALLRVDVATLTEEQRIDHEVERQQLARQVFDLAVAMQTVARQQAELLLPAGNA